jgi:hypothetical protein
MVPQQLLEARRRRPFEPFRIVQTDGTVYEIRHPEMMVGLRSAVVGLNLDPAIPYFDRTAILDLRHIIRIEPLPASAASQGNGQS